MTDPSMADHIYLKPLTTKSIIEILKAHPQIDAVLPTMGGQTALNLCLEADEKELARFRVRMIGVDVNAINITENREQLNNYLKNWSPSAAEICTYLRGKEIAQEFGFQLRPSFTLGVQERLLCIKEDFDVLLTRGLEASPIHEVLIDKALMGWKEYELELLEIKMTML
jgi:carbamoyl-phosphate synthase large subunit